MRHISKTNGVRELDIYFQIPPLVCDLNYFYSSTEKSSAQRFEIKTEDMRTTPPKAMGVGSLTTTHRASKCLPPEVSTYWRDV